MALLYLSNPDNYKRKILKGREWALKNPEIVKRNFRASYGKPCSVARTARYRAKKMNAMPKWANKAAISKFYTQAKNRERDFGIKYHVDHIIPLQGENVCGLHIEYNLQILPAKINQMKSNKVEGEEKWESRN